VAIIALILVLVLAWNYVKLLLEAAERYILLGVLIYTAPVAFATGASQSMGNIFKSWYRMLGGQMFLLVMNAWCLRLFTSMVGNFISNDAQDHGDDRTEVREADGRQLGGEDPAVGRAADFERHVLVFAIGKVFADKCFYVQNAQRKVYAFWKIV